MREGSVRQLMQGKYVTISTRNSIKECELAFKAFSSQHMRLFMHY